MCRESVRIDFLIASLNDLDIFACNIGNSYLTFTYREKLWKESGIDFGTEKGMEIIIARYLYVFKIFGSAWRAKVAETLYSLE